MINHDGDEILKVYGSETSDRKRPRPAVSRLASRFWANAMEA